MKYTLGVLLALIISSVLFVGHVHALTLVEWDRSIDSDQVDHYEVFVCTTHLTCSPLTSGIRLGVNVAQPPIVPVTLPSVQRVGMAWPLSSPVMGRVSVVAVDVMGNKSGESNVVVFRAQPLNAPKGLTVK